jgi:hypothetical protein
MKKLTLATLIAAFALSAVVLISLFGPGIMSAQTHYSDPAELLASDLNAVATASQYYLATPPYFPNSTYKITKVLLENATLWVNATYKENADFPVPENHSCYIVNGTIRNDYSTQQIIQQSKEGQPYCSIGLDIYLFDSQGSFVSTLNQGNPFRGCSVLTMISGEESSFKVSFATPSNDVATFKIYVSYLDPMPLF